MAITAMNEFWFGSPLAHSPGNGKCIWHILQILILEMRPEFPLEIGGVACTTSDTSPISSLSKHQVSRHNSYSEFSIVKSRDIEEFIIAHSTPSA